jgi:hypothetical protein
MIKAMSLVLVLGVLICSVLFRTSSAGRPISDYSNVAQSNQNESSKPSGSMTETRQARARKTETKIVPRINFHQSKLRLWADGKDPAIITISLEVLSGGERYRYKSPNEMVFILEPPNVAFVPSQVRIAREKDESDPFILTAQQPMVVEVNCLPTREYKGLTLAQPATVEFITPINRIGIEPASESVLVNISKPFEIYLYDSADPNKSRLAPADVVDVQLLSENGNGKVLESPVQLSSHTFSKFASYLGRRPGGDVIIANAHYERLVLKAKSDRWVKFQWWSFLAGVLGAFVGSLGSFIFKRGNQWQNFCESFASGVGFCLIVILFPIGTNLPQITDYLSWPLVLFLALMVSYGGPELLKLLLSFVPRGGPNQNAEPST